MITDIAIITALEKHHLFSNLQENQLKLLLASAQLCSLKAAETLFYQGDKSERFYFVINGKFRLYRIAPSGHEKVVDVVREGHCFGEALMFSKSSKFPVTADALSVSTVVGFENQTFMKLLRDDAELGFSLMTLMSQRLHSQLNEIENLSLQNALHRLVNFLMRELENANGSLTLDVPKRLLASQLAIQPETLSRLLKKLVTSGVISVDQNTLKLLDKQRLYELASDNQPLRSTD